MRAAVAALATLAAAACAPTTPAASSRTVDPCATQPGITCDPVTGHLVALPRTTARGQLAVVFNGAGASPQGYQKVVDALSGAGFHVAALRYPSAIGTNAACPNTVAATDPDCHRGFRGEITFGAGVADPAGASSDHPVVNVSGSNSVSNRLLQLVAYLAGSFPTEGWEQFVAQTDGLCTRVVPQYAACDLDWSRVVLVGHSLGAGQALYLARSHEVARVAMISGPYDEWFDAGGVPTAAPWIAEGGFATPTDRMFGLTHTTEPNAAGQRAAWDALGMSGPPISVDSTTAPYGGFQQLATSLTPACPLDTNGRHNATAQDACTPGSPPQLAPAWLTLAGA